MSKINFYIRLAGMIFWLLFTSVVWLILSPFYLGTNTLFARTVNFLGEGVLRIAGLRYEIEGKENLTIQMPCVYTGNHQSGLDVAIYGAICPKGVVAVGKKEISYIPIFGWLFVLSGGILLDRKNRDKAISQLDAAVTAIKERKVTVGILPEGTRNRAGKGLLPFKKGAFHLAIAAGVPIVPIIVSELSELANFDNRILRKGTIFIKVLPPISTQGMGENDVDALSNTVRSLMLKTLDSFKARVG